MLRLPRLQLPAILKLRVSLVLLALGILVLRAFNQRRGARDIAEVTARVHPKCSTCCIPVYQFVVEEKMFLIYALRYICSDVLDDDACVLAAVGWLSTGVYGGG